MLHSKIYLVSNIDFCIHHVSVKDIRIICKVRILKKSEIICFALVIHINKIHKKKIVVTYELWKYCDVIIYNLFYSYNFIVKRAAGFHCFFLKSNKTSHDNYLRVKIAKEIKEKHNLSHLQMNKSWHPNMWFLQLSFCTGCSLICR